MTTPPRILHTMIRVADLERSLAFYVGALGMTVQRREDYPDSRFTLAFVGYDDSQALIELTHNWDTANYERGNGYGHIAIGVQDIYAECTRLAAMSVAVTRAPGPMAAASDSRNTEVIAFVADPDGYQVELIQLG